MQTIFENRYSASLITGTAISESRSKDIESLVFLFVL